MKGVILAGGLGKRLLPMTRVTNKHLLPVYDRPMVHYPLQQMVHAGVEDILIVTGGNHAGSFLQLLRNGHDFGLKRLRYVYQEGEGGIAAALALAEDFAAGAPIMVLLGDNLFEEPLAEAAEDFRSDPEGAMVLLKEVADPERFGVARLEEGRLAEVIEKPDAPPSALAVTGCYFFDARVFDIIRGLKPSSRGELEITDVNNRYIEWGAMRHRIVSGWWTDAGTVQSLHRAGRLVAEAGDNPVLAGFRRGGVQERD